MDPNGEGNEDNDAVLDDFDNDEIILPALAHMGSFGFNAATIQHVIAVNEAYKKLSLAMFHNSPMNPHHVNYAHIENRIYVSHLYTRYRTAYHGVKDQNVIDTMAIGEFLAYDLPDDYYNTPEEAEAGVISVMKFMLAGNLLPQYTNLTPETYTALVNVDTPDYNNRAGLPGVYPYTQAQINDFTIAQATPGFLRKVIRRFNDDIGIAIDLDKAAVRLVWSVYGILIPDARFAGPFNTLSQIIPEVGLRMRLTIQQTVGAGLTCFTMIRKALDTYPDFPWDRVARILNPETTNGTIAAGLIGDDPYFGFHRDLGPARSTQYKNLAWVAAQLLIRKGGYNTLQQFGGLPAIAKEQGQLMFITNIYIHETTGENLQVPGVFNDQIAAAHAAVTGWQNYTM